MNFSGIDSGGGYMNRGLKWMLAGVTGALGLFISFVVPPTVFECKLITACHEINTGYAIVSIFSSDASSTIAEEQKVLQIAHSLGLTVAFALFGFLVGFLFQRYQSRHAFHGMLPVSSEPPVHGNLPSSIRTLQLAGISPYTEYYLKIESRELAEMRDGLVVGRDPECAPFAIESDTISRAHARLSVVNGRFALEDMGSTNGTTLNGRQLPARDARALQSGDKVAFGSVIFGVQVT